MKKRKAVSREEWTTEQLKDPAIAAGYVNECLNQDLEDGGSTFLRALGKIAKAHGISHVAQQTNIRRENVYRILSQKSNPAFFTLLSIIQALDFKFNIKPNKKKAI